MKPTLAWMLLMLVAGCTGPALPETFDSPETPAPAGSAPEVAVASVDENAFPAPAWENGTWWTFRVASDFAAAREITSIVAGQGPDAYLLAAPDERQALEPAWWHLPPVGAVSKTDLSWEAHDEPISLLHFPLQDGARWKGTLEGEEVAMTAHRTSAGTFEVDGRYASDELALRFVYDPAMGQLTNVTLHYSSEETSWASMELVASGHGWGGARLVPSYDDAYLGEFGDPRWPNTEVSFDVPKEATHVVIGCTAWGLGDLQVQVLPSVGDPAACGGTHMVDGGSMQVVPMDGAGGTWHLVPTTLGPGSVFVEATSVWLLDCDEPADSVLLKPGHCF